MKLLKIKPSQIDPTIKHIYECDDGRKLEYVYTDNGTGKDIICIPSQTGCKLGCRFCFLTARKDDTVRAVTVEETLQAITEMQVYRKNPDLLISFMGMGEPLLSIDYIFDVLNKTQTRFGKIRYGVSTIVPNVNLLNKFIEMAVDYSLLRYTPDSTIKLHYSWHMPDDVSRLFNMPSACLAKKVFPLLSEYREMTKFPVEIHYTPCAYNISSEDAEMIRRVWNDYRIPFKFIHFNERPDKAVPSITDVRAYIKFIDIIRRGGVNFETYTPPGADVHGCCGQFELE